MLDLLKEHKSLAMGVGAVLGITILLVLLISVLTSKPKTTIPGDTPITATPPPNNSPDKQVSLRWWGGFLTKAQVQPLIDKYQATNPGVKIEYSNEILKQSDIAGYRQKLNDTLGKVNNAAAPDIYTLDSGWVGALSKVSAPAPSTTLNVATFNNTFHDFVGKELIIKNQVYALPLWVDTFALIYNKQLWAEAGLEAPDSDWFKFRNDQVAKLTKRNVNKKIVIGGFAAGVPSNSESWFEALNILMLQNKVRMTDTTGKAVFATGGAQSAINFYKQFANTSWNDDFGLDATAFLEGKVATILAPSSRISDILRHNRGASLKVDFGVVELPQLKTSSEDKANLASYWAQAVNSASSDKSQAWDFLNFLSQKENLELLNQSVKSEDPLSVGLLYPRKDMVSSQLNDPYLSVYAKSLSYATSWYMYDESKVKNSFAKLFASNSNLQSVQAEVNQTLAPGLVK